MATLYTHQSANVTKTFGLLGVFLVLVIGMGFLFAQVYGNSNILYIAVAISLLMNIGSYWWSDKLVLSMVHAKPVTRDELPELWNIVEYLSITAGLPMPKVYLMDSDTPNAFATGRNPQHAAVAATTGILRILSEEELAGVMAHELAHVKNRDILIQSVAATFAGAITYLAHMAQFAAIFGGGRSSDDDEGGGIFGMILMAILAPIAAMLVQMAISRSREFGADAGGASISGNPLSLANALQKLEMGNQQVPMHANAATAHMFIVSPLTGGGMMSLFSTHPPMAERVARLQEMSRTHNF